MQDVAQKFIDQGFPLFSLRCGACSVPDSYIQFGVVV